MKIAATIGWVLLGLFMVLGTALIFVSSVVYLIPGADHPFLVEKLPISRDLAWRLCLRLHVVGGLVCLPAALPMFSGRLLKRFPWMHRGLGRVYALAVLGLLVPTGLYLALFAKGGALGIAGFMASGILTGITTAFAVRYAITGNIAAHRRWIIRSFAQIASAITFRILHMALDSTGMDYMTNYLISLWIGVLGNAAFAELIIAWPRLRHAQRKKYETESTTDSDRAAHDPVDHMGDGRRTAAA